MFPQSASLQRNVTFGQAKGTSGGSFLDASGAPLMEDDIVDLNTSSMKQFRTHTV